MVKQETDEEMAKRLQREFDTIGNGRTSRSGGGKPAKKRKVVRKSIATIVNSDGEEVPRKRRAGNDAFNKDLLLR